MKLVNSIKCNNDSICDNSASGSRSIIIIQSFTKENKVSLFGKKKITQTKTLVLPYHFRISISVKVEINNTIWEKLRIYQKKKLWLKLRKQLYWSCEIPGNIPSLCTVPSSRATSILMILISDAFVPHNLLLQCCICFLNSVDTDIINLNHVSRHLETMAFNLHQYLPQQPSNEASTIFLNVTRTDQPLLEDDIDKVFITNISITDLPKEAEVPMEGCKFVCGWGPTCLDKFSEICNGETNCVQGEDEDNRLCEAFKLGIIPVERDFIKTSTTPVYSKGMDHRVMSTFNSYLFMMICAIILFITLVFFVCFVRRSRDIDNHLQNKKSRLHKPTTVIRDSDTSCSTCDMKSRLHLLNGDDSGYSMRKLDDLAYHANSEHPIVTGRKISYPGQLKGYHHFQTNLSMREARIHHKGLNYSKKKEALETADWLNLFFHVSSEARQKSLATQPPPNINNGERKSFECDHNFSITSSTCVFPVMI